MTITDQVTEFHCAFGVPIAERPTVPDEETARLRLRLVAEEFCEFLEAHGLGTFVDHFRWYLALDIANSPLDVDLTAVADACADLDYVVEGTRLSYGIPREPVAAEVHRSNMAKLGGPVVNGKITKPDGWTPPDIQRAMSLGSAPEVSPQRNKSTYRDQESRGSISEESAGSAAVGPGIESGIAILHRMRANGELTEEGYRDAVKDHTRRMLGIAQDERPGGHQTRVIRDENQSLEVGDSAGQRAEQVWVLRDTVEKHSL